MAGIKQIKGTIMSLAGEVDDLRTERDALRAQRDSLLAALEAARYWRAKGTREMTLTPYQALQECIDQQSKDEGLWFVAETAPEAYLQQELRKLHTLLEDKFPEGEVMGTNAGKG